MVPTLLQIQIRVLNLNTHYDIYFAHYTNCQNLL